MQQILAVAGAGAIGCVLRLVLAQTIHKFAGQNFPYGILTVNVLGCLIMGILAAVLIERYNLPAIWRAAILVGFLGGFTTFSSFTIDTINLFEIGAYMRAATYVFLSVILCLLATWGGILLGRNML